MFWRLTSVAGKRRLIPAPLAACMCLGAAFALAAPPPEEGDGQRTPAPPALPDGAAARPVLPAEEIPRLIDELNSDRYAVRQQATQRLRQAGSEAIPKLAAAARNGGPEVVARTVRLLQSLYVTGDDATIDAVEAALEDLAQLRQGAVAHRAEGVLIANADVRERRAVSEIRRLGGVVRPLDVQINNPNLFGGAQQIALVLGQDWKGGDEGLKYVRRLTTLRTLYISRGPGVTPISDKAREQLAAEMPLLDIQDRGLAYMGVGGVDHDRGGCEIRTVEPEAAADKAGLRPGDVITQFGGQEVADFKALIELIAEYRPEDRVSVEVKRGGRTVTLEVELGVWKL